MVDSVVRGDHVGPGQHERDPHQHLRHPGTLALQAVVTDVVPVVGDEDDEGVVKYALRVEVGEQSADLVVDQPQHAAVGGAVAAPVPVVARSLLFQQVGEPPPRTALGLRRLRPTGAVGDVLFGEHREVGFGCLVGVVRLRKGHPAEERPVRIAAVQRLDRVGDDAVRILALQRKRCRFERRAVVYPTQPGGELPLFVGGVRPTFVPVRTGEGVEVVSAAVHVRLAGEVQGVARRGEHVQQVLAAEHLVGRGVLAYAMGRREAPGEQAGPRGHARRGRRVGVAEARP
nr:hypothetical protein [Actinopolymorpha singaporensis]